MCMTLFFTVTVLYRIDKKCRNSLFLILVNIYLHSSHLLSTSTYMFSLASGYILMIRCEHCDVDAYYRLSIEDFNSAEVHTADLCLKCIKIKALKAIGDFPAIKSLKIEPVLSVSATTTTTTAAINTIVR
jgi:hypothetical protein